jgi:hypothetical protein
MRDMKLVEASVVMDDSTGNYSVGELDFGVPGTTVPWLDAKPDRRKALAEWLRWLADQCEKGKRPFEPMLPRTLFKQ